MEFRERIIEFLRAENISSANFALQIGVQPSGISHIISGRNKPSLDFIVKMLGRYPSLSTDWLLFGKGKMLKESIIEDLFPDNPRPEAAIQETQDLFDLNSSKNSQRLTGSETGNKYSAVQQDDKDRGIKASRIIVVYNNDTFSEYFPR